MKAASSGSVAAGQSVAAVRLAYGQEAFGELDDLTRDRPSAADSRAASNVDDSFEMDDDGRPAAGSSGRPCCCWSIGAAGIHLSPVGQAPD